MKRASSGFGGKQGTCQSCQPTRSSGGRYQISALRKVRIDWKSRDLPNWLGHERTSALSYPGLRSVVPVSTTWRSRPDPSTAADTLPGMRRPSPNILARYQTGRSHFRLKILRLLHMLNTLYRGRRASIAARFYSRRNLPAFEQIEVTGIAAPPPVEA